MLIVEILLIIIGLAAVVLSCRLSETGESQGTPGNSSFDLEEAFRQIKEQQDQTEQELEKRQEELLERLEEQMNTLSNQGILGVNEYSSQVIDKIEKNHGEVVFLYNMLNEKEEELKKLVHHVDVIKAQLHDELAREYQVAKEWLEREEKVRKRSGERSRMSRIYDEEIAQIIQEEEKDSLGEKKKREEYEKGKKKPAREGTLEEKSGKGKASPQKPQKKPSSDSARSGDSQEEAGNHNAEIIRLYRQGNSVLDISRMLSLGQGEVAFVIDLYGQRGKRVKGGAE